MHLSCSTSSTEEQNRASSRYLSLSQEPFYLLVSFLCRETLAKRKTKMLDIQGEQHLNMLKVDLSK
jgi:hypothetical protein